METFPSVDTHCLGEKYKRNNNKKKEEPATTKRFSAGEKEIVNILSTLLVNYSNFTNP